jgi:hypothetical protein
MGLMHPSRYGLFTNIFMNVLLFGHKFNETLFLHVWLELFQNRLKLRLVFVFSVVRVKTHFSLHIVVVLGHKLSHPIHHIVFPLCFNCLLVILQFPCK